MKSSNTADNEKKNDSNTADTEVAKSGGVNMIGGTIKGGGTRTGGGTKRGVSTNTKSTQKPPKMPPEPSRKEQRRKIHRTSAKPDTIEQKKVANGSKLESTIRSKPPPKKPSSDPKREKTKLKRKRAVSEENTGIQTPPHKVARSAPGTPPPLAVRKPSSRLSPTDKQALESEGQSVFVTLSKGYKTAEFQELYHHLRRTITLDLVIGLITVGKSYYVIRYVHPSLIQTLAQKKVYSANVIRYSDPAILADELKKIAAAPYTFNDLLHTVVAERFTSTKSSGSKLTSWIISCSLLTTAENIYEGLKMLLVTPPSSISIWAIARNGLHDGRFYIQSEGKVPWKGKQVAVNGTYRLINQEGKKCAFCGEPNHVALDCTQGSEFSLIACKVFKPPPDE